MLSASDCRKYQECDLGALTMSEEDGYNAAPAGCAFRGQRLARGDQRRSGKNDRLSRGIVALQVTVWRPIERLAQRDSFVDCWKSYDQ